MNIQRWPGCIVQCQAEIDPLGWGDEWNMTYADTDTRLHLYEYDEYGSRSRYERQGQLHRAGLRAMTR